MRVSSMQIWYTAHRVPLEDIGRQD